ncbi:uncharacterized protein METZ01_LOCUS511864, partial [marine metagenome]
LSTQDRCLCIMSNAHMDRGPIGPTTDALDYHCITCQPIPNKCSQSGIVPPWFAAKIGTIILFMPQYRKKISIQRSWHFTNAPVIPYERSFIKMQNGNRKKANTVPRY